MRECQRRCMREHSYCWFECHTPPVEKASCSRRYCLLDLQDSEYLGNLQVISRSAYHTTCSGNLNFPIHPWSNGDGLLAAAVAAQQQRPVEPEPDGYLRFERAPGWACRTPRDARAPSAGTVPARHAVVTAGRRRRRWDDRGGRCLQRDNERL